MKVCILAFSEGKNLELAVKLYGKFQELGVESSIIDLVKLNLPLYNTVVEKEYDPVELVAPFRLMLDADGFIFLAPEYNGGPPPSFSNFLAWVSRSSKQWREVFNHRPAAIGTHSAGNGLSVLTIMRLQLAYVGMNVLGRQIHTTLQKTLDEKTLNEVCEQLMQLMSCRPRN